MLRKESMCIDDSVGQKPTFSIVIPVYNRHTLVERAIKSVREQLQGPEVEIVAVDDASTDGSLEYLLSIAIKYDLVVANHLINQGIGPTRNTGIRKARGEWIVPLDSDDELAPYALQWLMDLVPNLPADVQRVRGMVRDDEGRLSPDPAMKEETWNYEDYLCAINVPDKAKVESVSAYRRTSLLTVPYPSDRSHELLFHLDYFKKFKVRTTGQVLRIYHSDAGNNTRVGPSKDKLLKEAPSHARQVDAILANHGKALRQLAPNALRRVLHAGVKYHLLCGNRKRALSLALQGFKWPRLRMVSYLLLGICGREFFAIAASDAASLTRNWSLKVKNI